MDRSFNYIISPEISEFRRFSPKLKIGVLASGKGTNFQELIDLSEKGELDIDIKVLITNKDDAGCIKRALFIHPASSLLVIRTFISISNSPFSERSINS